MSATTTLGALSVRIVAVAAIALALAGGASSAAAAVSAPTDISIVVPAPGHNAAWAMPFSNDSADSTEVWFQVRQEAEEPLPLIVEIFDDSGRTVLGPVALAALDDTPRTIGHVPANTDVVYTGRVSMPREVGNYAQGRSQSLTVALTVMNPDDTDDGELAATGLNFAWLLLAAAVGALATGVLLAGWRKRSQTEDPEEQPWKGGTH